MHLFNLINKMHVQYHNLAHAFKNLIFKHYVVIKIHSIIFLHLQTKNLINNFLVLLSFNILHYLLLLTIYYFIMIFDNMFLG